MKRLHKKIGVGVLVAGLLLGGGALSKVSVAHADSIKQQRVVDKVEGLASRYKFGVVDKKGLSLSDLDNSQLIKFKFYGYDDFERVVERILGIARGVKKSFIEVEIDDRGNIEEFIIVDYKHHKK